MRIGRSIDEEEETEGELVVGHASAELTSFLDIEILGNRADEEKYRYQCASEVDTRRSSVRTVQPFRLREPKQLVATHTADEYCPIRNRFVDEQLRNKMQSGIWRWRRLALEIHLSYREMM